jgi:hypothetical protein
MRLTPTCASSQVYSLSTVLPDFNFPTLWKRLPLIDMLKNVGVPPTDWEGINSHEPTDSWWDQFGQFGIRTGSMYLLSSSILGMIAALLILALFHFLKKNSLSSRASENQFAIIAPVTHCKYKQATEETIAGQRKVGNDQFDFYGTYVRWFDFWLKGIENGITKMPKLQICHGQEPMARRARMALGPDAVHSVLLAQQWAS